MERVPGSVGILSLTNLECLARMNLLLVCVPCVQPLPESLRPHDAKRHQESGDGGRMDVDKSAEQRGRGKEKARSSLRSQARGSLQDTE